MKEKIIWILAAVLLFGGMGVFYSYFQPGTQEVEILEAFSPESTDLETFVPAEDKVPAAEQALPQKETTAAEELSKEAAEVYIHVCGQVKTPGVYVLEEGSRVSDAIEAAGGLTKEAQESSVNLARKILDGEQLYIASKEEAVPGAAAAGGEKENLIDINSAGKEELMELPGIGAAKAEAIIAYRTKHGGFQKVEELKQIEGIKDGVLEKIKDKIRI